MRNKFNWLTLAATALAAFTLFTESDAQQGGKKGPPFGKKGGGPGAAVTSEQIIERLM